MNWIRQATGKPLEWMGWINTNTGAAGYAKSLEGRVELTKEDSVSMTHLKLSGLKAEDSAVYYCARWHSDVSVWLSCTKKAVEHMLHTHTYTYTDGHKYIAVLSSNNAYWLTYGLFLKMDISWTIYHFDILSFRINSSNIWTELFYFCSVLKNLGFVTIQ
uniref:Immunoglobulin V-set domain-containing protein n=1 Tax=Esox lucius TaxID=8010 RepID=A0AAY5K6Y9_ESOLU